MSENLPAGYYATTTISDWANLVDFTPGAYFAPATIAEMTDILTRVLNGAFAEKSVRFLGGRHSCSKIFDHEMVIDTSRLPLEFTQLPGTKQVTASGYMHARDFLSRAAAIDLSLTALGGTDQQTLAGLISTNTAGATVSTGVYDLVDWIEYLGVAADGKTIELKKTINTDPAFKAIICSLGAVGFITRVGFTLVDQLFFEANFEVRPILDVLQNMEATSQENPFWRIEWLPGKMPDDTTMGLFWYAKPVSNAPSDGDYPLQIDEDLVMAAAKINEKLCHSGAFLDGPMGLVYEAMAKLFEKTKPSLGPMRNMIPCDRLAPVLCAMAEWSFDPADYIRIMQTISEYFGHNQWPNLPIEMECTRTDEYLMSPWNADKPLKYILKLNFQYLTVYLDDEEKAAIYPHLEGLWNALIKANIPFKAHWGKINFLTPETTAAKYRLQEFLPYTHPMFMNDYLRQRLGG